jgi:hypothetical protein
MAIRGAVCFDVRRVDGRAVVAGLLGVADERLVGGLAVSGDGDQSPRRGRTSAFATARDSESAVVVGSARRRPVLTNVECDAGAVFTRGVEIGVGRFGALGARRRFGADVLEVLVQAFSIDGVHLAEHGLPTDPAARRGSQNAV